MVKENNSPTKQGRKPGTGNGGSIPPVERRFGQPNGNPRHNGAWKKEDTARYKLEQMLKLSQSELLAIYKDEDAPLFERKLADCINKGNWKEIEGMMNQVYGLPKAQTIITGDITTERRPYKGLTIDEIRKALGKE